MARVAIDDVDVDIQLPANLLDIVVNILVVIKFQQLNIELLWKAHASGAPIPEGIDQMKESNLRLADSMERVAAILAAQSNHPD